LNNYGYESKKRREKIYFRVYRSISFFTGFVECQEQGLQQRNKKKEQYEYLLRKYRERIPDADENQLIKIFNSLPTDFRKELKRIKDSEKKWYWSRQRRYFEEMKFLVGQKEPCTSLNT
jgi:Zn-dependent M32 family carboxypeptidase